MKCRFIREQKYICGVNYREIDLFPITDREKGSSVRAKKQQASRMVQQNLNGKNAQRYLGQLVTTNFTEKDLHVTSTYADWMLPQTAAEAEHDLDLYLSRIAYHNKKRGHGKIKFIAVLEYREADVQAGDSGVRFHHHIILSCGLDRDFVESLWYRGKDKEVLGTVNADRLQLDRESLERLTNYLTKYTNRTRRWKQSIGLAKPVRPRPNDGKYTRRKLERIAKDGSVWDGEFWHKQYPGWELNEAKPVWNEHTGEWSIYLKMRRTRPSDEKRRRLFEEVEKRRLAVDCTGG